MPEERIQLFEGSQKNKAFLSQVANRTAPEGFDLIIDDASHIGELTRAACSGTCSTITLSRVVCMRLRIGAQVTWMIFRMAENSIERFRRWVAFAHCYRDV